MQSREENLRRRSKLSPAKRALLEKRLREGAAPGSLRPVIARRGSDGPAQLSFSQERLWFLDQLDPGNTAYNIASAIRLEGALDLDSLRRSLNEVVRLQGSLRTTFTADEDGRPAQVIAPALDLPLTVIEADPDGAEGEDEFIRRLAEQESRRPFDLARGPLLRATLLRLSERSHVLLLTVHHIVSDAWSMGILFRDLAGSYAAFSQGREPELAVPPVSYADYSEWQRGWLNGEVLARQVGYWKEQLAGAPAALELPTDRPRPAVPSQRGATCQFTIPAELAARLSRLSEQEGTTIFMTLLAAFKVLLYRYTGQKDVVVGSPIAGRSQVETEPLIGFFVNTLALRTELDDDLSFREALRRVREVTLGAYAHEDLPFEKVVDEVKPERNLSRHPIFQVMMVFQNAPMPAVERGNLKMAALPVDAGMAKFDLTLLLNETEGGIYGTLNYSSDLFDHSTIRRMADCLLTLLEAASLRPETPVSALPLLDEEERRRLLSDPGGAAEKLSPAPLPHVLFEQQAAQHPDRVALVCGDRRLTYAQLDAQANRLARLLRARRAGPESRVALLFERSVEMVVALLGVLKAGAAYVPLDPALPEARLAFMLADSAAALVLTATPAAGVPEGWGGEAVCVGGEEGERLLAGYEASPLGVVAEERSAAYVIYTSGSTGRPKGVVVEHAQLARYVAAFSARIGLEHAASFAMVQPLAVDSCNSVIYPSLASGGTLHLIEPALAADAPALSGYMTRHAVALLKIAPSHLRALEREGGAGLLPRRWLVVGGEASERGWLRRVRERAGGCRVFNHYGPTETTVGVLMHEVAAEGEEEGAGGAGAVGAEGAESAGEARGVTVPAGRPLAGTRAYVLDGRMGPVPEGVCGELYVGGGQVARGYGGAAGQTAERFVPDAYGGEAGGRLYRTGDVVRRLGGGEIEFVGRADEQVKVRGYRVELGEVESALRAHPAVVAACAVVREVAPGDGQLVAYVVADHNQPPSAEQLRGYLQERLPQYMLPSFIVRMDALPLTRSGKVDKLSLPAPEAGRSGVDAPMVLPRTLEEELLAGILADVLRVEQVGIHDNFFALGGDSMRSIQVLARARQKGLDITNEQLFQHQTVAKLAQEVRFSQSAMPPPEQTEPFSLISEADRRRLPDDVEDAYPLAQLQAGMIFHSELNPDSAIYHDLHSFQLRVQLDPAALREAVHHVVNRHAVLRTSFDLSSYSEPLQLVHKSVAPPLTFEDLRHLTPAEQEEAITLWQEEEKRRRYEWGRPPLLRVHVHVRSEESFQLTLSYHHAIIDGWSSAAMQTELFNLYTALREDPERAAPPPPPPVSYSRFVALEQQALKSEESRAYWARQLAEPTVARLPAPAPDAPTDLPPVEIHNVPLPPEVVAGIFGLARAASVPLKSVLLAAHFKVISVVGGVSDVLTGAVTNGRPDEPDADQVLGLFLNTVPFRMRLKGGTWEELIQQAFEAERNMLPFRRFPLAELQRLYGGQPLFDAVFNFVSFHVFESVNSVGGGLQVLGYKGYNELNFPLTVTFQLVPGPQLYLDLIYRPGQLEPRQAQLIGHYFARTLADMARDPRARYERADVLREEEKRQLREWNETRVAYPRVELAHELFEAQAARTPRAVAAVADAGQLTYEELEARANRLARHLRKRGVGPDVAVGLLVERSPEMLVGLLGVLKAGGAYVPLDPAYPKQRLAFMARDADMPVLLTQSHLAADLPEFRGEVIRLDGDWAEISREPSGPLPRSGFADNLCYVIYTSGSTGQPKGISLSHGALTNLVQWHQETLLGGARTLQFASLSFDASFHEIFAALSTGGQVFLISEAQRRDIAALGQYVREHRVEKVTLPVTVLQQLAEECAEGGDDAPLASLREVTTTGEQMKVTRPIVSLFERLKGCRVHNHYGPAETHVVTAYTLGDEPQAWPSHPPIGRPIANTTMHVLDAHLQLVPPGVTGELYIGGVGLARGYHKRPGVTAEKFIPDPFSGEPGARLYRSGDLGRYLPDGNIVYAGRVDHMVKIRGQRVELAEIEAALSEHPAVDETVVLAADDGAGQTRLVAYVVPNGGPQVSVSDLHAFLKEKLPVYMLPSAFVMLDSFPLNANGKVDRRALPAPDHSRPELDASYVAPRTAAEELIAGIWSRVLKIEKVGLGDNFFELGGHSLLATQLVSRVRQTFRVDLPLPALYDKPTVEGMLEAVSAAWGGREIVEEIAHTLRQIEALSEEEVQAEISKGLSG